jgi:hypothetical protein
MAAKLKMATKTKFAYVAKRLSFALRLLLTKHFYRLWAGIFFCMLKFLTNARASRKRCQKKRHIEYGRHLEFLRKKFLHKSKVFRQPIKQNKNF